MSMSCATIREASARLVSNPPQGSLNAILNAGLHLAPQRRSELVVKVR